MITDEMIASAVVAYGEAMANSLPEPEDCECEFSPAFLRKMRRLIRRVDHPVRYHVMRTAAAVLLFLLVSFGTVMAISPTARTAVIGWLRDTFIADWMTYNYHGSEETSLDAGYFIANLPKEYDLERTSTQRNSKFHTVYKTPDGKELYFTWLQGVSGNEISVSTSNNKVVPTMVRSQQAELYISDDPLKRNTILWQSSDGSTIFAITAHLDGTELIALAESVTAKK